VRCRHSEKRSAGFRRRYFQTFEPDDQSGQRCNRQDDRYSDPAAELSISRSRGADRFCQLAGNIIMCVVTGRVRVDKRQEATLKLFDSLCGSGLTNSRKQVFIKAGAEPAVSEIMGVMLLKRIENTLAHLPATAQRLHKR
jgi:hypothetical protein